MPGRRVTFQLGTVLVTPGVEAALDRTGETVEPYLERYLHSDFGLIPELYREKNNEALLEGSRGPLIAAYHLKDRTLFYISTDEERTQTLVYLGEEVYGKE